MPHPIELMVANAVRDFYLKRYRSVTFLGKRSRSGEDKFEIRRMNTTDGIEIVVINACYASRHVECHVLLPEECPSRRSNLPCVSVKCIMYDASGPPTLQFDGNEAIPERVPERIADLCALPTWLQLACSGFTLPEMENYWDVIPVMMAMCLRCAMNVMFIHDRDYIGLTLLTDEFDQKYAKFSSTERMALDQLTHMDDENSSWYCATVGSYILSTIFRTTAYSPVDKWQSAVNREPREDVLMFKMNMSAIRYKILQWMCQIEDELRQGGLHAPTIRTWAKLIALHTYQIFNHVNTITIGYSFPCGCDDGGDSAPTRGPTGTATEK